MSDSLKEQLLKLGFKSAPVADAKKHAAGVSQTKPHKKSAPIHTKTNAGERLKGSHSGDSELDLARAYALRARSEREAAEKAKQEALAQQEDNRQRKIKMTELLAGRALNLTEAPMERNFQHRGKIRRIWLDEPQHQRLQAGELAVVFFNGRYLLVEREIMQAAQSISPESVALWIDPAAADEAE